METIDIIILTIFLLGAVLGFMSGLIKQATSLAGILVGLMLARMLFATVGAELAERLGTALTVGQILAFLLIWVLVPVALSIVAHLLTGLLSKTPLGFINRWLGAGAGAVKYLLFASLVVNAIEYIDVDNALIPKETKEKSYTYYSVQSFSGIFLPPMKDVADKMIQIK